MNKFDLNHLGKEVLDLLAKYELEPKVVSLDLVLSSKNFDIVADNHPHHKYPGILQISHTDSERQWGILVRREMKPEDFPPGAIMKPTE